MQEVKQYFFAIHQQSSNDFCQMLTVYNPLTWGIYTTPPPDVPKCGFIGELCIPSKPGRFAINYWWNYNYWWNFSL